MNYDEDYLDNEDNEEELEKLSSDEIVIECPNCSYPIIADSSESAVKCPCCGNPVNVIQPHVEKNNYSEKVSSIKTVSAAKAYIEFMFEKYDWIAFSKNPSSFSIPEIDILLEIMKTNEGDNKDTWKMCFDYSLRCVNEKINNVDKNIDEIVVKFVDGADRNGCDNNYDIIKEGISVLKTKENKIITDLENYLDYSKRFGIEEDVFDEMTNNLNEVKERISKIDVPSSLEDLPKVKEIIEKKDKEILDKYLAKGINACEIYQQALDAYNNNDYVEATDKFVQISDYKSSRHYLDIMRSIYCFSNRFIYMYNNIYYMKNGKLYKNNCKLADYSNVLTNEFNLYIGCYGNLFYYFSKHNKRIINYLVLDEEVKKKKKEEFLKIELYGKYVDDSMIKCDEYPQHVFFMISYDPINDMKIRKSFLKERNIESSFKPSKRINYKNWHDILSLDLKSGKIDLLVEGASNLLNIINGFIYYIAPLPVYKKQNIVNYSGTGLFSYDMVEKQSNLQVTGDSRIHYVNKDNSIIFTRNDHGDDNKTIYIKASLEDSEEKVLVSNVYKMYRIINGKIFYLVGNSNVKSLCSINLDGSGYLEVMKYMQDVSFVDEDWFYITRGDGDYRTLYRLPINGGKPERIAFGINKEDLEDNNRIISHGYLYFTNYNNILCRTRLNGTGYEELVKDVYYIIKIENNKLFYICLDEFKNGKEIKSLYNMNLNGSNRQKLIYNLDLIKSIDETHFIYVRDEKLDSKRDLYNEIEDKKINKQLFKMYKKFDKKHKYPKSEFDVISLYDIKTYKSTPIAYLAEYPNVKALKQEMKEVLKK